MLTVLRWETRAVFWFMILRFLCTILLKNAKKCKKMQKNSKKFAYIK